MANGTLVIEDVRKSDSGLYLCRASNGVATDLSKVVRVTVHGTLLSLMISQAAAATGTSVCLFASGK